MARERTSFDVEPKAREPFDLSALMTGGPEIEAVDADSDIKKRMEEEAFMNEILEIRFLDSGDPNATKMVEVMVNTSGRDGNAGGKSVAMGFERGVKYRVPRYIFEVIAHAKTTTLQQVRDQHDPMKIMHVERHAFSYPCEVLSDPNPAGGAWRDKVLSDPA